MTPPIHIPRLVALRDQMIRTGPEHFDMAQWAWQPTESMFGLLLDEVDDVDRQFIGESIELDTLLGCDPDAFFQTCGTVACLAGHAMLVASSLDDDGGLRNQEYINSYDAARYLGMYDHGAVCAAWFFLDEWPLHALDALSDLDVIVEYDNSSPVVEVIPVEAQHRLIIHVLTCLIDGTMTGWYDSIPPMEA